MYDFSLIFELTELFYLYYNLKILRTLKTQSMPDMRPKEKENGAKTKLTIKMTLLVTSSYNMIHMLSFGIFIVNL